MADKICRNCSMMIPGDAKNCPYCRKSQSVTAKNLIALLAVIFILFTCGMIQEKYGPITSAPQPSQAAPAPDKSKDNTNRALAGALTLKNAMRNPDSFKLASVTAMDSGTVCYQYRSQNGFGGMNVGKAVLLKNNDIITNEMEGFSKKWNKVCAGKTGENVVDYVEMLLK